MGNMKAFSTHLLWENDLQTWKGCYNKRMSRFLKRSLRFAAFTSLLLVVFLTNIGHKLGFTSDDSKNDTNKPDDLFASFTSVPSVHADTPGNVYGDGGCPNTDAGPCGCGGTGD